MLLKATLCSGLIIRTGSTRSADIPISTSSIMQCHNTSFISYILMAQEVDAHCEYIGTNATPQQSIGLLTAHCECIGTNATPKQQSIGLLTAHCEYIGTNATPKQQSIGFLTADLLVFAFSDQLGLYSLSQNQILTTVKGHSLERTNCLVTAQKNNHNYVFAGYSSGAICCFTVDTRSGQWQLNARHQLNASVIALAVTHSPHHLYLFSNDSHAQVHCFSIGGNEAHTTQQHITQQHTEGHTTQQHTTQQHAQCPTIEAVWSLCFPLNKMINSVAGVWLPECTLVFLGGVDQKIHCYSFSESAPIFNFTLSGHQDAITKLALSEQHGDILLASSSKDGYIRIWRITSNGQSLQFHRNVKDVSGRKMHLDAVLTSHECSVTGIQWMGNKLVSCSLDCTICVWACTEEWTVQNRMGQLLGNKNAYFQLAISSDAKHLAAVNYTGAVLLWSHQALDESYSLTQCFTGHTASVRAIEWDHTGNFLVSASHDQTTRVICRDGKGKYHQISRAQIHGYDINAVSTIKIKEDTLDLIVCGADEKVIRIVEPPACFANYLNTHTPANLHLYFPSAQDEQKYRLPSERVMYQACTEGGTQVLGLMTKQQPIQREIISTYYEDEEGEMQQIQEITPQMSKVDYSRAPHEDYLVKHTLWPQLNKLYGHPHQIQHLARSPNHSLLASSCTALSKQAASVIIWDTTTWKMMRLLSYHTYTVHTMQFSSSGKLFATGGKDRRIAIYNQLELLFGYEAHARSVTALAFHPDEHILATGSKDKTIKLHSIQDMKCIFQVNLGAVVSALGFGEGKQKNILACGCGDGTVNILQLHGRELTLLLKIENGHSGVVNALKWNGNRFATCGDDCSVRIYSVNT